MKINEISELTGISKKNIRYYETENLLMPRRNKVNKYREYDLEDVAKLKEIKLFRKLGISLIDITLMQNGVLSLECCMKKYSKAITKKQNELQRAKEICDDIIMFKETKENLQPEKYLGRIENYEARGSKFMNIANDFINGAKSIIKTNQTYTFFPEDPIMNKNDFTNELFRWGISEKKR